MKRDYHRHIIRHTKEEARVLSPSSGKRLEDHEFRPMVKSTLKSLLPDFDIFDYSQNVSWSQAENIRHQPDLMMVSKSRRTWIVVEVELSDHVLGYSYNSDENKASDHIYPQVEVFAEGNYDDSHIKKISEKLGEPESSLKKLTLNQPDVLVIGDKEDVIRLEERRNWSRLENDFENVHLGFVETFKWEKLATESCITYSGWLPSTKHGEIKIRLVKDKVWPRSLRPLKQEDLHLDEENVIEIDGIPTNWSFNKDNSVLIPMDEYSIDWMQVQLNKGSKIFEISLGPASVKIRKV